MIAAALLDVLLVLLLIVYLAVGFRLGFARTLSALVGVVVGAVLAFLAIPLVVPLIPESGWRVVAAIAIALALLIGGQAAGRAVGEAIRGTVRRRPLAALDRLLGGIVGVIGAALAVSLVIGSLSALGAPFISRAAAGSVVVQTIDRLTPGVVQAALARVRSAVLETGLPRIGEALGGVTDSPGVPQVDTGAQGFAAASAAVVRISGSAIACGQNQSGSGFVAASNRIITNAHVVAGVDAPVVEAPNGQVVEGRVVYFDPVDDLAVIATRGLQVTPLAVADALTVGEQGVVDGYPYGGPFVSGAAEVLAVSTERVDDIYGGSRTAREVVTLAAVVEPGNSGGPLILADGSVGGVVFAESAVDPQLGYAMTATEFGSIALGSPGLTDPVEPGRCVRG